MNNATDQDEKNPLSLLAENAVLRDERDRLRRQLDRLLAAWDMPVAHRPNRKGMWAEQRWWDAMLARTEAAREELAAQGESRESQPEGRHDG